MKPNTVKDSLAAIPMLDMALSLYSDGTGIEAYTPQGG